MQSINTLKYVIKEKWFSSTSMTGPFLRKWEIGEQLCLLNLRKLFLFSLCERTVPQCTWCLYTEALYSTRDIFISYANGIISELGTFDFWISGLMLDPLYISRLLRIYAAITNPTHCLILMVHHRDETPVSNPNVVCFIAFHGGSLWLLCTDILSKLNIFE